MLPGGPELAAGQTAPGWCARSAAGAAAADTSCSCSPGRRPGGRAACAADLTLAWAPGSHPVAVPVVFLELPVVILFALYPGLVSLSQIAR